MADGLTSKQRLLWASSHYQTSPLILPHNSNTTCLSLLPQSRTSRNETPCHILQTNSRRNHQSTLLERTTSSRNSYPSSLTTQHLHGNSCSPSSRHFPVK